MVDATNPLKESHNEIAKWILRDLNKPEFLLHIAGSIHFGYNATKRFDIIKSYF